MKVKKRDGKIVEFDNVKIYNAIKGCFESVGGIYDNDCINQVYDRVLDLLQTDSATDDDVATVEMIQDFVEDSLFVLGFFDQAKAFILYREQHKNIRDYVNHKTDFIAQYKESANTANATIDDNSNVANKNIGILNAEIHKTDNIQISRGMVMHKLKELFPESDAKQYIRDLESHIIYKHDESSFAGAVAPYCCSITMYPFLNEGIKGIGGLSAAPKNLDSYCGMYINLIFATSSMFAGAVATSEFLLYFDYFARKEWGDNYYTHSDEVVTNSLVCNREKTIKKQIHQYFQQVIYSINQPAAARGMQSAFVNFSYFDKPFFDGMFGDFVFPDGSKPTWDSLWWLQKEFMQWFNQERLRCLLTFPVESFTLLFKDGKFADEEAFNFVCEEYARGHSFFTYISDTVDSLSSCCRLKNKIQTKEFNFTNGNMGVQTGSKSVITLNLNRIIQDWFRTIPNYQDHMSNGRNSAPIGFFTIGKGSNDFFEYLERILERVFNYHVAYNELLWDMHDAGLLPVYTAGFINLNKQYLTIGLNGLNQAAEFLGIQCTDNPQYQEFCEAIFSFIKDFNSTHKGKFNGHQLTFNTELVPAESLAIKNYNWDKEDGYWVPEDTNLYASYIFKPNEHLSVLEKLRLHGRNYIGDFLDGGSAAHINLSEHLSTEQYRKLIQYAAEVGCQYFTWNIPNCECGDCGFIAKQPFDVCPKCGSKNTYLWDRVIGYLTKVKNWSEGRQIEQKTRVYSHVADIS